MKDTYSFSLEQEAINKILDYQYQFRLSSRSAALERMLMEEMGTQDKFGVYENLSPAEALDKLLIDFKIAHDRILSRCKGWEEVQRAGTLKEMKEDIKKAEKTEIAITADSPEEEEEEMINFVIEEDNEHDPNQNNSQEVKEDKIIRKFPTDVITKETRGTKSKKSSIVKMALDNDDIPD